MTDRETFERNGYLEIPKLIIDPKIYLQNHQRIKMVLECLVV